jgi:hypothetical protein
VLLAGQQSSGDEDANALLGLTLLPHMADDTVLSRCLVVHPTAYAVLLSNGCALYGAACGICVASRASSGDQDANALLGLPGPHSLASLG